MSDLSSYVNKMVQFKMIDFHTQVAKDRLNNVTESLIVIQKDNLTDAEFKSFILTVEKKLQERYETNRMQILTKYHYILKVSTRVDLPKGV